MLARWGVAARRLVLLAGVLSRVPIAAAQQPAVSVERIGAARLAIEPGAQATLTFRVSNRTALEQLLQGRLELPPGWLLVIPEPPVRLSPHETELRLLRIALPPSASAGVHAVRYAIAGARARDSVLVSVPGRRRIEASVRQAPRFVSTGDRFEALFAIRNTGNAPATIRLSLSESDGFPARLDSAVVHLDAGEERVVRAEVQTAESATRRVSHRVRLVAAIESDTVRIEPMVALVEVIPRRAERAPRFRSLPSELTLRQIDRAPRPTVELRGGGALSSAGTTTAGFLFRGPNDATSLSGEQDEYWLSLASPGVQLRLGDRSPTYSRLGESWRPGFGADGDLTLGALTVGGFSQRDRRSYAATRQQEHGGSLDARLFGRARVGAKYLTRSGTAAGDVWTAHARLTPSRAATLDGEYGRGRDSAGGGDAYAVELTGAFARASYALRRLASDSGFPGLTRGNTSNEVTATLIPFARLSLSGSFTDWTATRPYASGTRVSEWQRAMDGRVAWGELLEAGYRRSSETRLVLTALRARRSEFMRLYLGVPLGAASLRGGIEQGVTTFEDAPRDRVPFRRLSVRGSVGRGENLVAASAEWVTGMPATSWVQDDRMSAALNVGMRVTPSTRLSAALSVTSYRGDYPRTPMTLDLSVVQNLPFGQRASWRTRAMSYGPGFPTVRPTHQADYVIPLGLPVGMSGESGVVEATLVDRDAGRPLAGVLVRLGDQAHFTDADGRVSFSGLAEATHYLEIDRGSLGADRVVVPMGPAGVTVHAGETERIELGVIRGARLQGTVRRFEARPSPALDAPAILDDRGSISGAVLQLSKGRDTLRASVDGWGNFSFGGVAPGSWVLSVIRADLPRYHRFEQERLVVELRPGDTHEAALRVIPDAPPVQIIAEAELTLDASSPDPRPSATTPSARWVTGRRQIVPPPAETAATRRRIVPPPAEATATPPPAATDSRWVTGRRREVPPPAEPDHMSSPPAATRHHYTVTRWDVSLVHIARVMYDDASLWPKIWVANLDQVEDPDIIRPGQRLRIPDKAPLTAEEQAARDRYVAGHRP